MTTDVTNANETETTVANETNTTETACQKCERLLKAIGKHIKTECPVNNCYYKYVINNRLVKLDD